MITTLTVLAFGFAALTQYLHIEAFLGAFVAGILVGDLKRFDRQAHHIFEVVTIGMFAPIFFAVAGLRVNLAALADPIVLLTGVAALAVAIAGKFVGTYIGAKAAGFSTWENISLGAGMNARGAVEIIVATIGLSLGVLTGEMYSIIVMVAIITSIMAPPLLRWTVPRIEMSDEERERLEREAEQEQSFVANIKRILIPTRGDPDSQFAAKLIGYMARNEEIEVTNMYLSHTSLSLAAATPVEWAKRLLSDDGDPHSDRESKTEDTTDANNGPLQEDPKRCFDVMTNHLDQDTTDVRNIMHEEKTGATQTVLTETERGYDLLVLGSSERGARPNDPLFGTAIDDIIVNAPCPVLVVDTHDQSEVLKRNEPVQRILLPMEGTEYNQHAAELAFAMARNRDALVEIVHYVNPPARSNRYVNRQDTRSLVEFGEGIVDQAADRGRKRGVEVNTHVFVAEDEPEDEILGFAEENDHDLIMMGSSVRPITRRAFFGHHVEHVIKNAPCPVGVLSSE